MAKSQIQYWERIYTFFNKAGPNTGEYSRKSVTKKLKIRNYIEKMTGVAGLVGYT